MKDILLQFVAYFLISMIIFSCSNHKKEQDTGKIIVSEMENDTTLVNCTLCQWMEGKEKAIVFTWDDTSIESESVAKLFDKYGYKATFFLNTQLLYSKRMRIEHPFIRSMYQDILNSGHEIGTHTHSHCVLTKVPDDKVQSELAVSSQKIFDLYGYKASTMSYPTSRYNNHIDSLMHIYYLDCRYTMDKDVDSTIRYVHVREAYNFEIYKKDLDSFISSNATRYVYGGHQMDGSGYEPISSQTLDSLLTYIKTKYDDCCWVTTFADMTLYNILRQKVVVDNAPGQVIFNTQAVDSILTKYPEPNAFITLCFSDALLDFSSDGIVSYKYKNGNSYVTIDLRKSRKIWYSSINRAYKPLPSMRNQP